MADHDVSFVERPTGAAPARASEEGAKAPVDGLSDAMRDLLWTVAQHKYGWAYVQRYGGQHQVAQALQRRGLGRIDRGGETTITATAAGREEIARRWPVSPFVLGTYEHQPGGWTPRDSRPRTQSPGRAVSSPIDREPYRDSLASGREGEQHGD